MSMAASDTQMLALLKARTLKVPEGLNVSQVFGHPVHGSRFLWERPGRKLVVHI